METLAERLARLMRNDQLSQTGLARKAGIAPNNVQAILTGHSKRPAADIVLPIARALGVSPDYLVFGEQQPVTTIAQTRERLADLFMELMGLLNSLDHEAPRGLLRVAETPEPYVPMPGHLPAISGEQAWRILDDLRRRGALSRTESGETKLTMVVELPEAARELPEAGKLFSASGPELGV